MKQIVEWAGIEPLTSYGTRYFLDSPKNFLQKMAVKLLKRTILREELVEISITVQRFEIDDRDLIDKYMHAIEVFQRDYRVRPKTLVLGEAELFSFSRERYKQRLVPEPFVIHDHDFFFGVKIVIDPSIEGFYLSKFNFVEGDR